jgi:flagellin
MLSVTTNTAALTAQRNLDKASTMASGSISKMSSGSRIVKPSDDAASLAISNKLRADIVSLEQAGRNASQGASLLQVAGGAYDRIADMLTRMKVLATQTINGTLGTTERLYAQAEFDNLRTQITNTAEQTRFAGVALLTGGGGAYLQGGVVAADVATSTANISDLTDGAAGLRTTGANANNFYDNTSVTAAVNTGFVHGAVTDIGVSRNGAALSVTMRIGNQIFVGRIDAANSDTAGDTLTLVSTSNAANSVSFDLTTAPINNLSTENTRRLVEENFRTLLAGVSYTTVNPDAATADNGFTGIGSTLGPTINGIQSPVVAGSGTSPGSYAFEYISTGGSGADNAIGFVGTGDDRRGTGFFRLTNGSQEWTVDVEDLQITGTEGSAGAFGIVTFGNGLQVYVNMDAGPTTDTGAANPVFDRGNSSAQFYRFDVGEGGGVSLNFQIAEQSTDQVEIGFTAATSAALGLEGLSVADETSATLASSRIDAAINTVNTAVANIGAIMSRFEFIQSTISTTVENVSAARGTFRDVDMSSEMTEFTKQQTLMRASIAMLSQANQMPQELLRLLQQ